MNSQDLHTAFDSAVGTFVGLLFIEALVKPIARQTGRYLLRKADEKAPWIPDFLHKQNNG